MGSDGEKRNKNVIPNEAQRNEESPNIFYNNKQE